MEKLSLDAINKLTPVKFHQTFSNVIECWPQASIDISSKVPFNTCEQLIDSFHQYLDHLDNLSRIKILQLHPDLAGRLADQGVLTVESTAEQASAGLDRLSVTDKTELTKWNRLYKDKFDFPFVICVRESKRFQAILSGLQNRMANNRDQEVDIGIDEVKKICKLRILQIIKIE